ncbi:MAG: 30S ribosome-binding factor RbfA [Alphaproteobacteria bacterium]|nr:30S ribosome-binding factor RbfA [Alphaproteobacteria bacterium]
MPRGAPRHGKSVGPSQRQLRVGEEIRRTMMEIFTRAHWREPVLIDAAVTITEARISPDLKNCTLYCMPLGGANLAPILAALNRARAYLRGELGHSMVLRHVPELRFEEDHSFEEAARIEALLRSPTVARDLKRDAPEDE